MPETGTSAQEMPPQVSELLATMRALAEDPPAGFASYESEGADRTTHTIRSDEEVPGYSNEPTHLVKFQSGDVVLVGEVTLPGIPLADGTPTIRHYNVFYGGDIQLWRFQFPHPDKIRTIESEVIAMLPLEDEANYLRNGLLTAIRHAVDEHIRSQDPEILGPAVYLELSEIEDLNRELKAIAQSGIS